MAKVILGMTTSLDGFIADQNGRAGRLYPDLAALRGTAYMNDVIEETGAVLMGKGTFEMGDPDSYVGNYEFQVPIFVLTHHPPRVAPKQEPQIPGEAIAAALLLSAKRGRRAQPIRWQGEPAPTMLIPAGTWNYSQGQPGHSWIVDHAVSARQNPSGCYIVRSSSGRSASPWRPSGSGSGKKTSRASSSAQPRPRYQREQPGELLCGLTRKCSRQTRAGQGSLKASLPEATKERKFSQVVCS
jgi:hypothetical protein